MIVPAANILDTNVVSEMMRPLPNPRVVSFLDSAAPEGMGISVISVWEIFHSIRQLPAGKRRDDLDFRFRSLVLEMFENRVFPWEAQDAKACADLMEHKRRFGRVDGQPPYRRDDRGNGAASRPATGDEEREGLQQHRHRGRQSLECTNLMIHPRHPGKLGRLAAGHRRPLASQPPPILGTAPCGACQCSQRRRPAALPSRPVADSLVGWLVSALLSSGQLAQRQRISEATTSSVTACAARSPRPATKLAAPS